MKAVACCAASGPVRPNVPDLRRLLLLADATNCETRRMRTVRKLKTLARTLAGLVGLAGAATVVARVVLERRMAGEIDALPGGRGPGRRPPMVLCRLLGLPAGPELASAAWFESAVTGSS
jgi:hypothetical protein